MAVATVQCRGNYVEGGEVSCHLHAGYISKNWTIVTIRVGGYFFGNYVFEADCANLTPERKKRLAVDACQRIIADMNVIEKEWNRTAVMRLCDFAGVPYA